MRKFFLIYVTVHLVINILSFVSDGLSIGTRIYGATSTILVGIMLGASVVIEYLKEQE